MRDTSYNVPLVNGGTTPLTVGEAGEGRPFLLLHGGAGPDSMWGFADRLAETYPACALAPIHPGFAPTDRPEGLASIAGLAQLYAALLDQLGLEDVVLVGSSIGGWIASELALLKPRGLTRLVLIDAVGIDVPGHPVTDVSGMPVPEIMKLSFHDPAPFLRDPATLSDEELAALAANQRALAVYAPTMSDRTLAARLETLATPTLVLWGSSDGIADLEYGRAYADAIPGARFAVLDGTGHMPQLETPELVIESILNELQRNG